MSTLISSAVTGKKAAPKAVARRRPPPTPTKEPAPISVASARTSVALPSPPPTQQDEPPPQQGQLPTDQNETPVPLPSEPEQARAPTKVSEVATQPTDIRPPSRSGRPTPIPIPIPIAIPTPTSPETTRSEESPARPATDTNEQPEVEDEDEELPDVPVPGPSKKRPREQAPTNEPTQPAKRVKRSSARSNAVVQAVVNEEERPATGSAALRTQNKGKQREVRISETIASEVSTETPVTQSTATRTKNKGKQREVQTDETPASAVSTAIPVAQKTQRQRKSKRKSAATVGDSDQETGGEPTAAGAEQQNDEASSAKPKRRKRKSKARKAPADLGEDAQTEDETNAEQQDDEEVQDDDSESDPENYTIDPFTKTMFDVTYHKRYGKTSEREKKMAEIDWVEVARKRNEELDQAVATATTGPRPTPGNEIRQTTEREDGTANTPAPQSPEESATSGKHRFKVVNGMIELDESGLTIDRQAEAEAEAATTNEPVEEDNDLTRRVNRLTYINNRRRNAVDRIPFARAKGDSWGEEETERFYEVLGMFGTDFFMISKMFAPRTRKQIKAKFTREERLDPNRVTQALLGNHTATPARPLDLEYYTRESGMEMQNFTKYEGLEHAESVIGESLAGRQEAMRDQIREEEEEEVQRVRAQAAKERNRKLQKERRAAKAAEGGAEGGKRGGRRKKALPGAGMGGGGGPQEGDGGAGETGAGD